MGREASASLDEDLDPLADGLPADGADGEGCAAVRAGAVAALEHQFDLVVDADRAGDALFHLPVAVLQLLHELPLVGGFRAGAALHLGAVCRRARASHRRALSLLISCCPSRAAISSDYTGQAS